VESSQIDPDNPDQREILSSSTHFNPVDLVCGLRDYKGRSFNLTEFHRSERRVHFYKIEGRTGIEGAGKAGIMERGDGTLEYRFRGSTGDHFQPG